MCCLISLQVDLCSPINFIYANQTDQTFVQTASQPHPVNKDSRQAMGASICPRNTKELEQHPQDFGGVC